MSWFQTDTLGGLDCELASASVVVYWGFFQEALQRSR